MNALPNILGPLSGQVSDFREEEHDLHVKLEPPDPKCCKECGLEGHLVRFGSSEQAFRDIPAQGKRVTIWVVRRRYKCKACEKTFRPAMPQMDDAHQMTKRLVTYVEKAILERTFADVGRECGLDEKTVRQVFQAFCARKEATMRIETPTHLGIDELFLARAYRATFTNLKERTVIEMLPSRNKPVISKFLRELADHRRVRLVCIDMYGAYRSAVREVLPQAAIVVDKFHITRMANEVVETVRKGLKAGLTPEQRRTLKGDRKLLLLRAVDLKPWQHLVMQTWTNKFPELASAYTIKERFYGIWDAVDEPDARERYRIWLHSIPDDQRAAWKPVWTAMNNWDQEVFAYFKPGHQFTNAFTESSNRIAKDWQRDTRGMKFENFRAKILLAQQHKVVRSAPRRVSPFAMSRVIYEDVDVLDYGVPLSTVMAFLGRAPEAD